MEEKKKDCTCSCTHCSKDSCYSHKEGIDRRIKEVELTIREAQEELKVLRKQMQTEVMSISYKAKRKELEKLVDVLEGPAKGALISYLNGK